MRHLLDADGLIKLHRAGVLHSVLVAFHCAVPSAVYDEVVVKGKVYLHEDAEEIEQLFLGSVEVVGQTKSEGTAIEINLGAGELAVLALAAQGPEDIVVSDDRRFLSALAARDLLYLTPADLLVVLARRRVLTRAEAMEALERLRPAIRTAAYWEAKEDLEGKVNDEK